MPTVLTLTPVTLPAPIAHAALTPLTASGNEITDATRAVGTQGDGRATPDSSFGIWEGSTNLCTNGGFETDVTTGWAALGTVNIRTRITSDFKFGTACLNLTRDATAGFLGAQTASTIVTAAGTYTASAWIKPVTGSGLAVSEITMVIRELNGAAPSLTIVQGSALAFDQWGRLTATRTLAADCTSARVEIYMNANGAGKTIRVDGVQFEAKSIATPYVETNGGSAARGAARVQAPSALLSSAQGWVALRLRAGWSSSALTTAFYNAFAWSVSGTAGFELLRRHASADWRMRVYNSGASIGDASIAQAVTAGDFVTLAAYWKAGEWAISVNGSVFTKFAGTIPANFSTPLPSTLEIGDANNSQWSNSDILWFACGTGTLTDSDPAVFATFTTNPVVYSFTPASVVTAVWKADTVALTQLATFLRSPSTTTLTGTPAAATTLTLTSA